MKNLKYKIIHRFKRRSFAAFELDYKLQKYLNFKSGFFIEAGANNGITQSNSLYFEKYLKWNGLLVEPIPDLAAQCKTNRPNCIVENYALVHFDYKESNIKMHYCDLMSLVEGAMKTKSEQEEHINSGLECQRINNSYEIVVKTTTLTKLLDKYKISKIDFFSLDVEGYELSVLKGLDLDKYCPTYMLIEARYRDEIEAYIKPYYEPIANLTFHDVLFKAKK